VTEQGNKKPQPLEYFNPRAAVVNVNFICVIDFNAAD
jgi:hypothetical protein